MKKTVTSVFLIIFVFLLSITSFAASTKEQLMSLLSENYNSQQYTADSYKVYKDALTDAMVIYENPVATEEQLLLVLNNLQNAKESLVPIATPENLRQCLLDLENLIYSVDTTLPDATTQSLQQKRAEIKELLNSANLTTETIQAAISACNTLISSARFQLESIEEFSPQDSKDDVIVPTDYTPPSAGIGNVTRIRMVLFWVGVGLLVLGLVSVVCYFIKSAKNREQ